ncbi:MAG: MetQ/NlpA family ABC transporter substrate-binding protein [Firmicutes bacterium]|nr:MetQ/NlpA family ABC transporter substrate-binding protein [Bacillota bacterium]
MKKFITGILAGVLALGLLAGCGGDSTSTTAATESLVDINVGATPSPHAEILEVVKPLMEEKGYNLIITEFTDYVQPNLTLDNGEIDVNFFQHLPYLEDFNAENGTELVSVAAIHYEPLGLYAGKTASIEELAEGAQIAVPNDTTNEARALLLLETNGLIKVREDAGLTATKLDIIENPLNLEIVEIEAAQLARSLPDVDMAVINGNYAIQAGLNAEADAIAKEEKDSLAATTYANILTVKVGNEQNEGVLALIECCQSETVKTFINDTYGGAVVAMF